MHRERVCERVLDIHRESERPSLEDATSPPSSQSSLLFSAVMTRGMANVTKKRLIFSHQFVQYSIYVRVSFVKTSLFIFIFRKDL